MFFSHNIFCVHSISPMMHPVIIPSYCNTYCSMLLSLQYGDLILSHLILTVVKLAPVKNIWEYVGKRAKKNKTEEENEPIVSILTLKWALQKRGKGLWMFFKVQHTLTDTEVVLLHSCRETSLGHRGTEGQGNQAPLCLAWTARLEKCLALEALCTHERTHWKDIRLRWEEEARGQKKEKQDLYGKSIQIWLLRHLLKTSCRSCHTTIYTNICTKICQLKLQPGTVLPIGLKMSGQFLAVLSTC